MKTPLVSVLVTTRNNHETLAACLRSIQKQTYREIELTVVDNNSTDDTKAIAKRYSDKVYNRGPERCAQRNFAASIAKGDYVLFIDSDMELSEEVVSSCIYEVLTNEAKAVIIPEESFGQGFWAQCKKLERSFYVGIDWMEAARFFDKQVFKELGGYDERLVSGEDWDLSQRTAQEFRIGRVSTYIFHNEGKLKLRTTLRKKYYYAQHFARYMDVNKNNPAKASQAGPLHRYKLFLSHPVKLFRNPIHGLGMLFMKTCEFGFGAIGYFASTGGGAIEVK